MGFTHQDLHPGNVVLHRNKIIILIDVGISQAVEEAHSEDGVYGRLEYLPPEVFRKEQYTPKSDVYCLGTLLWRLITGVPPRDTVLSVSTSDELREELIPDAPPMFNDTIQSCWHLDPDQRPSAREVYNRLIECAAHLAASSTAQPSNENQILGALSLTPQPFSSQTQSFIISRRTSYHQHERCSRNDSNTFEFLQFSQSIPHDGSKFFTREQLTQVTKQHSSTALVTTLPLQPNRGM